MAKGAFSGLVTSIDMFAQTVGFSIAKKQAFGTWFGTFFTFFMSVIFIVVFYYFGLDFLNKTNPISNTTIYSLDVPPFINLFTYDKMFIAIRPRTASGYLAIDDTYFVAFAYTLGGANTNARSSRSSLMKCSAIRSLDLNYITKKGLNDFYCLQLGLIGGANSDPNNTYTSIIISFCTNTDGSNPSCKTTLIPIALDGASSNIAFDIFYPQVFYDYSNYINPLRMDHILVTDSYQGKNYPVRDLFFSNKTLTDDKGYIFSNPLSSTLYGVGEMSVKSLYKYTTTDNTVYNLNIRSGINNYSNYIRSYQKIQSVIANTGGFVKIITIALGFVLASVQLFLRNLEMINMVATMWKRNMNELDPEEKNFSKIFIDASLPRQTQKLICVVDEIQFITRNLDKLNDENKNNTLFAQKKLFEEYSDSVVKNSEKSLELEKSHLGASFYDQELVSPVSKKRGPGMEKLVKGLSAFSLYNAIDKKDELSPEISSKNKITRIEINTGAQTEKSNLNERSSISNEGNEKRPSIELEQLTKGKLTFTKSNKSQINMKNPQNLAFLNNDKTKTEITQKLHFNQFDNFKSNKNEDSNYGISVNDSTYAIKNNMKKNLLQENPIPILSKISNNKFPKDKIPEHKISTRISFKEKKIEMEKKRENEQHIFNFSCLEILRKKIFCCIKKSEYELWKWEMYVLLLRYVEQMLDVAGYINNATQFRYLKKILLNSAQRTAFDHLGLPPLIFDDDKSARLKNFKRIQKSFNDPDSKDYEEDMEKMVEYFSNGAYQDTLTLEDRMLMNHLNFTAAENLKTRLYEVHIDIKNNKVPKLRKTLLKTTAYEQILD